MPRTVHVFDHPLVQHKLTLLRKKETSTTSFRRLLNEIGSLMAYEVTRDMPMHDIMIQTPLETMNSKLIDGKKLVFVPILRAGMGLLDGFLTVVPGARDLSPTPLLTRPDDTLDDEIDFSPALASYRDMIHADRRKAG